MTTNFAQTWQTMGIEDLEVAVLDGVTTVQALARCERCAATLLLKGTAVAEQACGNHLYDLLVARSWSPDEQAWGTALYDLLVARGWSPAGHSLRCCDCVSGDPRWEIDLSVTVTDRVTVRAPTMADAQAKARGMLRDSIDGPGSKTNETITPHACLDGPMVEVAFFDLTKNPNFMSFQRRCGARSMPARMVEHVVACCRKRLPSPMTYWTSDVPMRIYVRVSEDPGVTALDLPLLLAEINAPYAGCAVYTDGGDYIIASHVDEAWAIWEREYGTGETRADYPSKAWRALMPGETVRIWCDADGNVTEIGQGTLHELPADEWIARFGRGPLGSMEG